MEPSPRKSFVAAYVGPSMKPSLRDPSIIEVAPYDTKKPLRVGDVVFFVPPGQHRAIVHRVVRMNSSGVLTLGDNNTEQDIFMLQPDDIAGRVVAAWRGQKRRAVSGGTRGRLVGNLVRSCRGPRRIMSRLVHLPYQAVSRSRMGVRLTPARLRARVVRFRSPSSEQYRLVWAGRVVGQYDWDKEQWQIRRPFRLVVDEGSLPSPTRSKRAQRPGEKSYRLVLTDVDRWEVLPEGEGASEVVGRLAEAMQMSECVGRTERSSAGSDEVGFRLRVREDADGLGTGRDGSQESSAEDELVCVLPLIPSEHALSVHLSRVSSYLALDAETRGGLLLHGALATKGEVGVILAAPGGTGKTTASGRLPQPWTSLCDDTTLVVRDKQGTYWAHPWPTWSRFSPGEPGGSWDVQRAVSLGGIFFLLQAKDDRAEGTGAGHAVSLLVECAEQAAQPGHRGLGEEELRAVRLRRFDNLCSLAQSVPTHVLHISLDGPFWEEIERVMEDSSGT